MSDKMTRPITNDYNALTGEYSSREMNDKELAQYEADNAKELVARKKEETTAQLKTENKASAADKLAALGLTADEIAALGN